MRCSECGSYNTVRDKGPLVRQVNDGTGASALEIETDLTDMDPSNIDQGDDSSDSNSPVPPLLPLSPAQSTEPMQDEDYGSLPTVVHDTAGSLTPPETPTREDNTPHRDPVLTRTTLAHNSVSMTPEPSPGREVTTSRRGSPLSSVARRVSCSGSRDSTGQETK